MRLAFASPTYGPVDPQCVVSQRVAIMHAATHGVTWVGDVSPDRMGFSYARNTVARQALALAEEVDYDGVFWCDSDMTLPPDAVSTLAARGKDFITAVYYQRLPPHIPLFYWFDPKGGNDGLGTFRPCVEFQDNVIAPIDACGFGCVLTSIKMLRDIKEPRFEWKRYGEDFTFCLNAAEAGYQLYVDTSVQCGHLPDPKPVTREDFQRCWAEVEAIKRGK